MNSLIKNTSGVRRSFTYRFLVENSQPASGFTLRHRSTGGSSTPTIRPCVNKASEGEDRVTMDGNNTRFNASVLDAFARAVE